MGDWRAAQYYGSQGVPQDVNMMRGLPQQYAQPPLRGYSYGQTQPVPMNVPSRPYQPEPRSAYNYNVGQPRMPPPPQYRTQPQSYPVRRYSSDHAPAVYAPPPRYPQASYSGDSTISRSRDYAHPYSPPEQLPRYAGVPSAPRTRYPSGWQRPHASQAAMDRAPSIPSSRRTPSPPRRRNSRSRSPHSREHSPHSPRSPPNSGKEFHKTRDASLERERERAYSFKLLPFVFTRPTYAVVDLKNMFPSLFIVSDFTSLSANWIETIPGQNKLALDKKVDFEFERVEVDKMPSFPLGSVHEGYRYNAKVMLVSGVPDVSISLNKPLKEDEHFRKQLRFLVGNDSNALSAFGGAWISELDGPDPSLDDTLKRTAIRTVRNLLGIDLSGCTSWIRFMEVRYSRTTETEPEAGEVTVIFLPSIVDIIPSLEEYTKQWEQRKKPQEPLQGKSSSGESNIEHANENNKTGTEQQKSEDVSTNVSETSKAPQQKEMSKEPAILITYQRLRHTKGMKPMLISIDGLLEYNLNDRQEATFEVSLFGELFSMMLGRDFGTLILDNLLSYVPPASEAKTVAVANEDSIERKREADALPIPEPAAKRLKLESQNVCQDSKSTANETEVATPNPVTPDSTCAQVVTENISKTKDTVNATQLTSPVNAADTDISLASVDGETLKPSGSFARSELLRACLYFDRAGVGFLRNVDVESVIHCLGYELSKRDVQTLVSKVVDTHLGATSPEWSRDKLYYTKLPEVARGTQMV